MQEKNTINRNISKKKSENIKIPKKMQEKIKDNNNYNYNKNCSNNNSILINKSNVKIDLNKNYKKTNLRSISHSTKCMMKIKYRDKEKDKYQPLIKTKKKYSITKDTKISKERNANKSKKKQNTKDILYNKNNNNDVNNHSFNYYRKSKNSNNNNSLKNIESSSYSDFYCPNNKHNTKQKIKKKDKNNFLNNEKQNNFILPFYYFVKKGDKKYNIKKKINYSEKDDYYNILQKLNTLPISELAIKIVGLCERKWLNELKDNLALIEKNKSINFETNVLNEFIKGRLIIQENFNWLLWAISYVFQNKITINKTDLNLEENNNIEKKLNFNNIDDINNILSVNDIDKWREGFIYNGVYFFLLDKIDNYNEIKIIKREIKSLNLLFLDYIQLLDNIPANINDTKPLLTNNIFFPLLSMAELTNFYIVGSLALEPNFLDKNEKNINEDDYLYNYYNEVDLSNYNMNNLKNSPFFTNLSENNLLNLNNGKFLLVHIAKDLHPLLIPKSIDNEEYLYDINYYNHIFLKYPLITNQIMKEENFFNKSSFLIYFKYFINYLISNKYITDMSSLEYEMNKFGINKCFYLFILSRIRFNNSCDIETNNNISSLIKIYILVKLLVKIDGLQFINDKNNEEKNNDNNNNLTKIFNNDIEKENKSETSCGTSNAKNMYKTNIKYNTEKKNELNTIYINFNEIFNKENNKNINHRGIKTISQLILFILSPKSIMIEINTDDLVQKLLYQCNIYLENFKKLSNKLFSNDVNSLYDSKSFLKSLIISARKNPLIFLSQLENKYNILFSYEIKYCTSICIENFIKYYNKNQIIEKDPKIISYINGEELSFYLIIKNISSIHQKNKSNCFKKKGSKMIKNVSYDNMDIYSGKYNYDNLSILNRSIIQPRNSNFKILNSSKDKPKIKSFNNIHICSNSNSKNINRNIQNKSNDHDTINIINSKVTNNSDLNTNKDSYNTNMNSNESHSIINKKLLSSYKSNQTQSTNNYKNTDNKTVADNFVIASSSSKDMFEFNYGDEDSDKSFNVSYGDSGQPSSFNRKRNTTNLNNSKFNLNSNKCNSSGNNCKTINAKNYNVNSNNNINCCINNIVINNKNPINNMTPSCSSGLINNHNKVYFGTENKEQFWRCLFNNYHLKFPYNLYKVPTQNNKSSLLIYRYLSMYYSFFPFYNNNFSFIKNANRDKNLNNQDMNISEILNEQKVILEKIFSEIISINSRSSYALINFYFYYFLNYYFVENNQLKECEQIISKINNIFENKILYKQNNYNIIINLINGLLNDKIDFLKTYKYFDKALILSLIQYGEPRGRNNDGNNIMIFPVWKTGRNCMILDNNEILNENYKELYHCLYFLYDNKRSNKSFLNDIKNYKLIDKNIINDLYRNIEYIKKIFKKNQKIKKVDELNIDKTNNPFENKNNIDNNKNNSKKKNSGSDLQNYLQSQNEDNFFNFDDEEMLERPSKANNIYDEFANVNEENNNSLNINTPIYSNNLNNILTKKNSNHFNPYNSSTNSNILSNNNFNSKIIPTINPEWTFDIYFKENSTYPNIIFPSMSDKKTAQINAFFLTEKFFIYFIKTLFAIINYSQNDLTYTNEYLKKYVFTYSSIINNNINNNNLSLKSTSKQKKSKSIFTHILSENLYYKKYTQSNIIVTFGNNTHCETGHKGYKFLSLPRVLYHLKNKEILSVKSGWEHSIAQDKAKMLYSWGNNSCCQCGFQSNETANGNIFFPKNISELNDKNIIEISCGNEHTLALSNKGEVYSWGSISDGVLGREIPNIKENCTGIAEPGIVNYFIKNNIKIRHISSGSIHNLCLDDKSNLYSFGCSKGGQLGLDEEELSTIYKHNNNNLKNNKNNLKKEKENNFSINEPKLIKALKDIEIIKISSGEAHNAALSLDKKCYVWGFGSNGQLGLGFCEDYFPSGEGMQKSRIFTPTVVKEFDKKNNKISNVFCGKTFTIFLNENDELYSTGINDLNQCGIDNNKTFINEYLCYDIVTPIKIEMFIRMKIINVSCGESHVLAITEDNGIKTLFSWGSNRFGQLGQGIQTKQSMPKIVNYFLHYNNSEVFKVSCGAFHSLALLKSKNEENINAYLDEKFLFDCIDKYEEY